MTEPHEHHEPVTLTKRSVPDQLRYYTRILSDIYVESGQEVRMSAAINGIDFVAYSIERAEAHHDDCLHCAWQAAEAVLPEGRALALHKLAFDGWAEAVAGDLSFSAASPAAALKALTAALSRNATENTDV